MSNKAKRSLFLILLILDAVAYVWARIATGPEWWTYIGIVLFIIFLGGYRSFSQAVKEDKKYGPIK